MKSKRKFRRLSVLGSVKIKLSSEDRVIEGYIANTSKTGLGAYIPKHIKAGVDVEIEMVYFGEDSNVITENHKGKIAWIRSFGHTYAIGVKYTDEVPTVPKIESLK